MSNKGFLSVSELSFDGIKNNLKTFLKSKTEFQDYDFEGSNLSALLDVLSYNTYLNSYYLNMVASEAFLDSAQIRSSLVSHAKELNYIPRSRTSARARVTLTISTGVATPSTIVVPENYALRTTVDNINLEFTTNEDIVITNNNGVYSTGPIYVYEGKVVEEFFTVDGATRYILSSENVDTSSIKVTVVESSLDSTNTVYSYSDNIFNLDSTSEVFFVQGNDDNRYEIVFGDNITGKKPVNDNIIKVKYRSTNGELGNRVSNFTTTSKIDGYDVTVTTNTIAADGSEREDNDSIKFYAPRHFTTQNRAVTKEDYVNLIRQKFPQIKTVGVYGGEDAEPPQYGKVIITPVPYGTIPILSTQLKQSIIQYLLTKTITTEPLIRDPEYLFIEVISNVLFDPAVTTKTSQQIKTEVIQAIKDFDADNLTDFGNDFRRSKLVSHIDATDPSILSNSTTVRAIYKIAPVKQVNQRIQFSFSNRLYHPSNYAYRPGEQETVKSNSFVYFKNGIYYNAFISDDGLGNLRVYYVTPTSAVTILEPSIGTVDYTTGNMNFDINPYNYSSTIDFYAKINSDDIYVKESKFLRIDYSKIVVNVSP